MPKVRTREEWLVRLVGKLKPIVEAQGHEVPEVRISCGWPSKMAMSRKRQRIGECWHTESAEDGIQQIFISPALGDSLRVADVTLHELVHAALPSDVKHGAPFSKLARACGLEGKPTATHAGSELRERLQKVVDGLGPYPHSALKPVENKKQSTRMLKIECSHCGYVVRTTQKWVEVGMPSCPDGYEMELA